MATTPRQEWETRPEYEEALRVMEKMVELKYGVLPKVNG